MRCPTMSELPAPPLGKTGWPWTEESPQLPDKMPDGSAWPRISIVTPSLNQGQFIEETIRSVLLQGYPDLEYIIIDGSSTDGSVDIIKKYEPWLTYWVSEPDKGQAHAINKGLKMATGEIVAWLNSDDYYEVSVMSKIAKKFTELASMDLIYGNKKRVDNKSAFINLYVPEEFNYSNLLFYNFIPQESCFWKRSLHAELGYLSEDYTYAMDYDLWLRWGVRKKFLHADEVYASQRVHYDSKTTMNIQAGISEFLEILERLFRSEKPLPSEIKLKRNKVLRHINERVAHLYFTKDIKKSRKYFLRSIYHSPLRIQNLTLLLYLLDTVLGTSLGRTVQQIRKVISQK